MPGTAGERARAVKASGRFCQAEVAPKMASEGVDWGKSVDKTPHFTMTPMSYLQTVYVVGGCFSASSRTAVAPPLAARKQRGAAAFAFVQ